MAKKNNNQVSAVRQAKHGWIWTLAFTVISILCIAPISGLILLNSFKEKPLFSDIRLHLEQSRFPLAGINLFMVLNVHSVAG